MSNPFQDYQQAVTRAQGAAARESFEEAQVFATLATAHAQMAAAYNLQGVQQAIPNR